MSKPSTAAAKKELAPEQHKELLKVLKARFEENMTRHEGLDWIEIQVKLEASPELLWSLFEMERTGGEPDVGGQDKSTGEYIFYDCSAESPKDRRYLVYDREAQEARKTKGGSKKGEIICQYYPSRGFRDLFYYQTSTIHRGNICYLFDHNIMVSTLAIRSAWINRYSSYIFWL